MTEIKRKASRIANGYWNMVDRMEVTDEQSGNVLTFIRRNRKSPNNMIVYGTWA